LPPIKGFIGALILLYQKRSSFSIFIWTFPRACGIVVLQPIGAFVGKQLTERKAT
jgi:hypothetical protein